MYRQGRKNAFLTIAGFEGQGNAGLLADLETWSNYGLQGGAVATALTVQDESSVQLMQPVSAADLRSQLQSASKSSCITGVKIGMLGSTDNHDVVLQWLNEEKPELVVWDPVFRASTGARLLRGQPDLSALLSVVNVVTPNVAEAEQLSGVRITEARDMVTAGQRILEKTEAVVITGGHLQSKEPFDLVCVKAGVKEIPFQSIPGMESMRGTGCRFSSALVAELADGHDVYDAVANAGRYVRECFRP